MKTPKELRYCETHEWVKKETKHLVVGISEYAQDEMGDIVFVDLPAVGSEYKKGESMAVIESVKAVSDIYAPVSGTITKINDELNDQPELINEDCYGGGWLVKMAPSDPKELDSCLTADEYKAQTEA